jgi:arginyl-tRNA synthetase
LIASGFKKYGSQEKLEENAIKHLFDIYVQVSKDAENDPQVKVKAAEWFKRMEEGDEEALKNWRVWRQMSIDKYAKEYETLNVRFDVYTGESEVKKKEMDDALVRLQEKGLIDEVDGALLVNLEKYKMGKAVVRKKGLSIGLQRQNLHSSCYRWNLNLPHPRYWRCHPTLRQIQIR